MSGAPDYSTYLNVKKINVAQTANANTSVVKFRVPNRLDGYFPLYKSIKLPINAFVSNKFTQYGGVLPPFTPLTITGLTTWLDAQDPSSYQPSGSNILTWTDKTTSKYVFSPILSSYPTLSTLNGYTAFTFGANAGMKSSSIPITTSYTVFIVTNRPSGTGFQFLVKFNSAANSYFFLGATSGFYATFAGNGVTSWWDTSANTPNVTVGSSAIMLEAVNDGSLIYPYTNGTVQNTKTGTTATTTGIALGSDQTGGQGWLGNVGEFLYFNTPLIKTDRERIEGYLAWKWGLVASLPLNHPYKNSPTG